MNLFEEKPVDPSLFPLSPPIFSILCISLSHFNCPVKEANQHLLPHPFLPHQSHSRSSGWKMQKSANPAGSVSPFTQCVTYQIIPGFSTTGPGNKGELSMEAAALWVQSPMSTSTPFKKRQQPSIQLYISAAHVLIAAIFFPLSVNKRDLWWPLAGLKSH